MSVVLPPDVLTFLIPHVQEAADNDLFGVSLEIGDAVPTDFELPVATPLLMPLAVFRDDGASPASSITFAWTGAVTVYANSKLESRQVARGLYGFLSADLLAEIVDSPITAVDLEMFNGPYEIPDAQPVPAYYFTIAYSTVGDWD